MGKIIDLKERKDKITTRSEILNVLSREDEEEVFRSLVKAGTIEHYKSRVDFNTKVICILIGIGVGIFWRELVEILSRLINR